MLELSTAQTDTDFEDVYRFWYDVYVAEMGRHINDARTSHQHRKLYDPLATAGFLYLARQDGEVVGTILTTPVDHPAIKKYRSLYGLDALSPEDQSVSAITTKLMVKANLRRTRLLMRMVFATYDWTLRVGMKYGYMDCNDHLLSLFHKLGYEQHLPTLYHADYGQVNSMRIELTNETHLSKVGSPILAALRRFNKEHGRTPHQRPQESPPQPARGQKRTTTPEPAAVPAPAA